MEELSATWYNIVHQCPIGAVQALLVHASVQMCLTADPCTGSPSCSCVIHQVASTVGCIKHCPAEAEQLLVHVQVYRHETMQVKLHGQSEFEASHVVIEGSCTFEVRHIIRLLTALSMPMLVPTPLFLRLLSMCKIIGSHGNVRS